MTDYFSAVIIIALATQMKTAMFQILVGGNSNSIFVSPSGWFLDYNVAVKHANKGMDFLSAWKHYGCSRR